MMNSQQNKKPIKKFNLSTEIRFAATRFKAQQKHEEWQFIPRVDILSYIIKSIETRRLPYHGTKYAKIPSMTMPELVSHIRSFGCPEEYKDFTMCRLKKSKPVFFALSLMGLEYKDFNGQLNCMPSSTTKELLAGYEREELKHKNSERHHPGTEGWSKFHSDLMPEVHVEAVFDVFSSLLRTMSLEKAWTKLLDILSDQSSPYSKLEPTFVFIPLLHIRVRGVFFPRFFRDSATWRFNKSVDDLISLHASYLNGFLIPNEQISAYRKETIIHQAAVNSEMKILRYPDPKHDHSKFTQASIFYYSWKWGVWEQFPSVVKHRIESGCSSWRPPIDTPSDTRFTMFESAGENVGKGLKKSMEGLLKEQGKVLDEKIDRMGERAEVVGERLTDRFIDKTRELMSDFFSGASNYTSETIDKFTSRTKDLLGSIPDSLDEISTAVQSFKVMFQAAITSFVEKYASFLPADFKIDIDALLSALKYYILLINTDNKFLKALLFFGILSSFGVVGKFLSWVKVLISYIPSKENEEEHEQEEEQDPGEGPSTNPFFTSESFVESIFGSIKNIFKLFVGFLGSVFSGRILTKIEFSRLLGSTANLMKNFHFIGGGILGITRIWDFTSKLLIKVYSWVKEKIFKCTPEKKILAKKVIVWVLKVRYFSSEAGMNAIRMSPNARKVAETLFSEGQALLSQVSSTSENHSKDLLMDVQRYWNDVKTISNYVSRINAMSTFQPTMFHIQLVGAAGVGKSTITKSMTESILKSVWGPDMESSFWSYNPNLEYFDGYAGQKVMIVDDMFRYQDPKHLTTLIGLITNTPIILPMANLEDKGCQMSSEIMLSSTNTPYPPSKDVLCMEAVHRRRHMLVNVVMDPRVRNKGTGSYDDNLYKKYYPSDKFKKSEFPHLRFHLIRSVPNNTDLLEHLEEGPENEEALKQYAEKLKEANRKILQVAFGEEIEIDPMFLFTKEDPPPHPIREPWTEWTYKDLLTNIILRFRQFRGMESTYTAKEKFSHVQTSFAEIDAVFAQAADIPEGSELEKVKLIESMFLDVSVPYGMDDPLGKRIYEELSTKKESEQRPLAPELEKVDLEKFFQDRVEEECGKDQEVPVAESKEPTFTGDSERLSLDEEARRRALIMKRKNKELLDPKLQRVLRIVKVSTSGPDEYPKSHKNVIRMDPAFLRWETANSTFIGTSRIDRLWEGSQWLHSDIVQEFYKRIEMLKPTCLKPPGKGVSTSYTRFCKAYERIIMSSKMVIPNNDKFPETLHGKTIDIPIGFLSLVSWDGINPVFEAPETWNMIGKIGVESGGNPYNIPFDSAFIWSLNSSFANWCLEFDQFSPTQQRILVEDAKWRNQYTGFYTLEKLAEDTDCTVLKKTLKACSYFLNPVYEVFNAAPLELTMISMFLIFFGVVKLTIGLTSLLIPKSTFTSKYLHRGPPSSLQHRPLFTSLFDNKTFNQTIGSVMKRNVREVLITDSLGRTMRCQALATGQYLILNKHCLLKFDKEEVLLFSMTVGSDSTSWEYIVERKNIIEDEDGDLAIAYSKHFPFARNIESYFIPHNKFSELELGHELMFLSRSEGEFGFDHNSLLEIPHRQLTCKYQNDQKQMTAANMIIANGRTVCGKSGSAVIYPKQISGAFAIVGIQAWATESTGQIYIQGITREKFSELVTKLSVILGEVPIQRQADVIPTDVPPNLTKAFTSPDYNNIITFTSEENSVGIVGKTQFARTPLANLMDRDGYSSQRIPAILSPKDPKLVFGSKIHPLNNSLNKYFKDKVIALAPVTLNNIKVSMVEYLRYKLDRKNFRELSLVEAVTGTREDGSSPMNLSSSPGIPYVFKHKEKGKKDWIKINEEGECDYISPILLQDYEEFRNLMGSGIIPQSLSYDFPKDELRPIEKVTGSIENNTPPKTRSVTCMNMLYVLLWRQLTLDMWASFHRTADGTFPFCPGINPEGPEWNNAYHYLSQFQCALDFDVSNWDGFFPPQFAFMISDMICELNFYKKNSPQELSIRAIMTELMFGYLQYGRVIYQKARGMISGFPGTAEINSLAHWILILYIYLEITIDYPQFCHFQGFLDNVRCLIYGDDIILTFSNEISPIFNGDSISQMYRSIGYPVTSADKSSVIPKYKRLDQCQFLKSGWNELLPMVKVRKMELSVAYDLLYWVRAKEQPIAQMYDNLLDALRIVFGHGRDEYNKFLKQVNTWLIELRLNPLMFTYDNLLQDHIRKYYT